MEFEDQEIAAIRNQEKKRMYSDLNKGIYAGDQLIKFSGRELFEGKISMVMPEELLMMPPDEAKQKYPSENRPQVILTDASGMVNFTFNLLVQQASPALLEGTLLQFRMLLQKVQPSYEFLDSGEMDAKNLPLKWFDFRSPGLDFSIYNLLWVASIEGRLLLGMFNAPFGMCQTWKFISMQMLETLTDLTIGGNESEGAKSNHRAV